VTGGTKSGRGERVHVGVTKSSRNSKGERCRIHERTTASINKKTSRIGIAVVLASVDDHARLTRAEIRPDEGDAPAASLLASTGASSAHQTVETIETIATVRSHADCRMSPREAAPREAPP
jgi:hypothetical protein